MQPWINALWVIDHGGDKVPLINLLRSNSSIPKKAKWLLADLLERYALKRPRGRSRTPAYDLSETEMWLRWADQAVRGYMRKGMILDRAIEKAALRYEVNAETLRTYHSGRHSSARRMRRRRPVI